jgi:hypothetical protein
MPGATPTLLANDVADFVARDKIVYVDHRFNLNPPRNLHDTQHQGAIPGFVRVQLYVRYGT